MNGIQIGIFLCVLLKCQNGRFAVFQMWNWGEVTPGDSSWDVSVSDAFGSSKTDELLRTVFLGICSDNIIPGITAELVGTEIPVISVGDTL